MALLKQPTRGVTWIDSTSILLIVQSSCCEQDCFFRKSAPFFFACCRSSSSACCGSTKHHPRFPVLLVCQRQPLTYSTCSLPRDQVSSISNMWIHYRGIRLNLRKKYTCWSYLSCISCIWSPIGATTPLATIFTPWYQFRFHHMYKMCFVVAF